MESIVEVLWCECSHVVATVLTHALPQSLPTVVQPRQAPGGDCPCKEEVEREEAQALVAALERSELLQNPLPYIPGLSGQSPDAAITIRVQEDSEVRLSCSDL